MPPSLRHVAVICLAVSTAGGALAAETTDPAGVAKSGVSSKSGKTGRRPARPATPAAGPAANLNAPSMDFTGVEAETGEPRSRRQQGPNVRPGLDSNGRPVMGLGF